MPQKSELSPAQKKAIAAARARRRKDTLRGLVEVGLVEPSTLGLIYDRRTGQHFVEPPRMHEAQLRSPLIGRFRRYYGGSEWASWPLRQCDVDQLTVDDVIELDDPNPLLDEFDPANEAGGTPIDDCADPQTERTQ